MAVERLEFTFQRSGRILELDKIGFDRKSYARRVSNVRKKGSFHDLVYCRGCVMKIDI
jgi:hypothetical protein